MNRRDGYEELEYVQDEDYLERFVRAGSFLPHHKVLDLGCGPGIVARALQLDDVVEIDLEAAELRRGIGMDARRLGFTDNTFDRVTARMVLHHATPQADSVFAEVYRVLKPQGIFVIAEGTPPIVEDPNRQYVADMWYSGMMRLKEGNRLLLDEWALVRLLSRAGFREIWRDIVYVDGMSTAGWLAADHSLSEETVSRIMCMRRSASEHIKRAYHQEETDDDVIVQGRFVIVTGRKPWKPLLQRDRTEQLHRCIPELWAPDEGATLLYVGATPRRSDYLPELAQAGYQVTVLEIWPDNCWGLTADPNVRRIVQGDVSSVETVMGDLPHHNAVFWWHGPEHLPKGLALETIRRLSWKCDLLVLGCPNKDYILGRSYGNPHEEHVSTWSVKDFEDIGLNAEAISGEGEGSHILAWTHFNTQNQ